MNSQVKRYIRQSLTGSQAQELLSPWILACATLPAHGYILVHQPGGSPNLILLDFCMKSTLPRHD